MFVLKTEFLCSEVLKGLSPGALAFMFNEENHEILGAFPAIIAALRYQVFRIRIH